jgi:phenylacetate-coenzyme A ligase PaaK-like adenylate-forming protein
MSSVDVDTAEAQALALFHSVAREVPAYAAFLAEHGVKPDSIHTYADFAGLPLIDKQNYITRYPLNELCRHGRLEVNDFFAVSSGSTGEPTFWPRSLGDEIAITRRFEQAFRDSFRSHERRTLAVVCFALGTWVGGMFTASCCRHLASQGYPILTVTPGNNVAEILRVVKRLAPEFDQTVLLGYPPFLKDVIDAGLTQGVNWSAFGTRLVMAGEVFSEEWRTLIGSRIGSTAPEYDFVSLYGTADAGVLGNETPLSIAIRRFLAAHPEDAHELFGESRLPTLVQYDPYSRFFETDDGTLLFSGDNGIPLVRYHIADSGGIVPFDRMIDFAITRRFVPSVAISEMPFVYVFGRADFTISYFGANVYPENVTVGLEQSPIASWVTGKFVMQVREDDDHNAYLAIVVELGPGIAADHARAEAIGQSILHHLRRLNSEFAHYVPPERQLPLIELAPLGEPTWFPVGVKHRYTRR